MVGMGERGVGWRLRKAEDLLAPQRLMINMNYSIIPNYSPLAYAVFNYTRRHYILEEASGRKLQPSAYGKDIDYSGVQSMSGA